MKKRNQATLICNFFLQSIHDFFLQRQPCKMHWLQLRTSNILLLTIFLNAVADAQLKINYDVFDKSPLGGLQIVMPSVPQQSPFAHVNINSYTPPSNFPAQPNPSVSLPDYTAQNNKQVMREVAQFEQQRVQEKENMNDIIKETPWYKEEMEKLEKTRSYRKAFSDLSKMNADSFSITKAVFTVENAYFDNKLSYNSLVTAIQERAAMVKQILKREGLSSKNNLALNYGIQKLYSQQNIYNIPHSDKGVLIPPIKYDFDDFRGEKDYSKMFVWKELQTGKGQCHSMPLLYLMLAEELGAKAKLSLAPQHSFIQFKDNNGMMMNFETTNANIVSNTWLMQSGFITAKALQEKTYLDTLSQRKLYAQIFSDLLLGYLSKFPYDDFAEMIRQKILSINPESTTALIVDANIKTQNALQKINAAGRPKEEDLHNYPDAYKAYLEMQAANDKVNDLGYQDMPKDQYQKWLNSIDTEKKKQAEREVKERMQREIQQLKNLKSSFRNAKSKQ